MGPITTPCRDGKTKRESGLSRGTPASRKRSKYAIAYDSTRKRQREKEKQTVRTADSGRRRRKTAEEAGGERAARVRNEKERAEDKSGDKETSRLPTELL